jgi:hypothetical protein
VTTNLVAHQLGKAREAITLELIQKIAKSTPWMITVRPATRNEDQCGKDIVIETAHGDVFVQVKGCKASVHEWRKLHGKTIGRYCAVVRFKGLTMIEPNTLKTRLLTVYQLRIREYWANVAGVDISASV